MTRENMEKSRRSKWVPFWENLREGYDFFEVNGHVPPDVEERSGRYLLKGNLCFGIYKDFLIVRAGKENAEKALKAGKARPFDITGRPMAGWVMVDRKGWGRPDALRVWLETGKRFAASLSPKTGEK